MSPIQDHALRYQLANELHARPFPTMAAPQTAAFLAIKQPSDAAARDRSVDRAHLLALLDRFGASHPQPDATHYYGKIGKYRLKWESHTEFVTYTIFADRLSQRPFDGELFDAFPDDWLSSAPGERVTSVLIRIEETTQDNEILEKVEDWFVGESVAVSRVLDRAAVVAGDFRIDPAGHMRFAVFVDPRKAGARRTGRIVQRLCEIETYKSMSMLGLARVREVGGRMGAMDAELTRLMGATTGELLQAEETLTGLLKVSSELENILAKSSFRFGATGAYETLVSQRIEALREERFESRQTFAEFMMRRYDPAMRTVKSAEKRLHQMAERASQAGHLLRTRVDVERQGQNQKLLASMDRRADLQLRLQKTVEGLSVVAISYYAVNLAVYFLAPFSEGIGLGKTGLTAIATPIVILLVWTMIRSVRNRVE